MVFPDERRDGERDMDAAAGIKRTQNSGNRTVLGGLQCCAGPVSVFSLLEGRRWKENRLVLESASGKANLFIQHKKELELAVICFCKFR